MLETLKCRFIQFIFGYIFIAAGFVTYTILFILLPLRWIGLVSFYRNIVRWMCLSHWMILPMIAQWWSNIVVNIYAHPDVIDMLGKENSVLVMNHRFHLDWLSVWIAALHFGNLKDFKCLAKKALLWIPIIGQALWFSGSVFLKRDVRTDKDELDKYFRDLSTVPDNYCLVLFSEGTRYTPSKHKASMAYAARKGFKPLQHHLLPRTKGFSLVRKGLDKKVTAFYDFTAMCPNDENPPLSTFALGQHAAVDILVRRFPFEEIPYDEEDSAKYLDDLYQYKDQFCDFYIKNQRFPLREREELEGFVKYNIPRNVMSLVVTVGWGILFLPSMVYFVASYASGISMQTFATVMAIVLPFWLLIRYILFASSSSSSYGQQR